jgi:hypothetical protein
VGESKKGQAPSDLQTPLPLPEFFSLVNGVYFIVIIIKTLSCNGHCPNTNLITKMGVAHTVGPVFLTLISVFAPLLGGSEKVQYYTGVTNG